MKYFGLGDSVFGFILLIKLIQDKDNNIIFHRKYLDKYKYNKHILQM